MSKPLSLNKSPVLSYYEGMLINILFLIFCVSSVFGLVDWLYLRRQGILVSDTLRDGMRDGCLFSWLILMALLTNVELTITVAMLIVLVVKLFDDFFLKPKRNPDSKAGPYIQVAQDLCWFLVIIWLIRSFAFNIYRVPSGSLEPTIDTGDFLLVNQHVYGVKLPVLHTQLAANKKPAQGDIALFYYPNDPNLVFVKRVIGLPGDHIVYKNKMLAINGKIVPQKDLGITENIDDTGQTQQVRKLEETLNGHTYHVIVQPYAPNYGDVNIVVPEGHYFMMGDNRDNSNDSRYWGSVPEASFIGKALMVWMSWDAHKWKVRWNRIGTMVQ